MRPQFPPYNNNQNNYNYNNFNNNNFNGNRNSYTYGQQQPFYPNQGGYQQQQPSPLINTPQPQFYSPVSYGSPNLPQVQHSSKVEALQLQNRILQARQQNVLYKQRLGQMLIQKKELTQPAPSFQPGNLYYNPYNNNTFPPKGDVPPSLSSHVADPSNTLRRESVSLPSSAISTSRRQSLQLQSPAPYKAPQQQKQPLPTEEQEEGDLSPSPLPSSPQESIAATTETEENSKPVSFTYQKQIHNLIEEINSKTTDHKKIIDNIKTEQISLEKRKKLELKKQRNEERQRIESLLDNNSNVNPNASPRTKAKDRDRSRKNQKQPLWRWKAAGISEPDPNLIMSSGSLFRAVVKSVIGIIIRPQLEIYKRKSSRKEANKRDFARSLQVIIETLQDWMGKTMQLPISSIVTDLTLDFDPKESKIVSSTLPVKARMLQLKVRLKTVIGNLSKSIAYASSHLLKLFLALLEDHLYYPDDFLFDCEKKRMEFDRLGGTQNILAKYETNKFGAVKLEEKFFVDCVVAKMLLIDILLVRILLMKVIFSPWNYGNVSKKPANRATKKVIKNLRVFATVFYYGFIREMNPLLPIVTKNHPITTTTAASTEANNSNSVSSTDNKGNNLLPQESPANSQTLSSASASVPPEKKSQLLKNILAFAGVADETPGFEEFQAGSMEFLLLEPRPSPFDSLDLLQKVILPEKEVETIQPFIEEWKREFLPSMNEWADVLVLAVVQEKYKNVFVKDKDKENDGKSPRPA
jgi:hypothetical protein